MIPGQFTYHRPDNLADAVKLLASFGDEARALALCEDGDGARSSVEIALVDAGVGDTLLVHAGTALMRLEGAAA